MNEPHDASLDDDQVIARLRAALDEVTADSNTDELVPAEAQDHAMTAGRWMAIAAAIVLVVSAVAVIAINRHNAPGVASTPTDTATPSTTEPTLIRVVTPWYHLISPDLVPGEENYEPCCVAPATPQPLMMSWARGGDPAQGLLTMTEVRNAPGSTTKDLDGEDLTARAIEGGTLVFASAGLSTDERETLADQVVPGSGLPYVLTAEGWTVVAMGTQGLGELRSQSYTNDLGTVTLSVGEYRGQLAGLVNGIGSITPATIAGNAGWRGSQTNGDVVVVWPAADSGQWAMLQIPSVFADRVDGLIAAVAEVSANTPTVESVPVPDTVGTPDASVAVGDLAPTVSGETLTGYAVSFRSEGSVLLVFVQPACTPCANVVSSLASAAAAPSFPVGPRVELVIQPPASRAEATAWLSDNHWTGDVILDREGLTSQAFAVEAVPRYVLIGDSGIILAIHDGALDADGVKTLITPQSPTVLGSFDIPTVATNFSIVDASGYTQSVVLDIGPSLIRGPSPSTPGSALDTSVVVATRSTFGTDVFSDLVKVGDRLTWTGPNGTQMYEVVWTEVCTGADCGTTEPYTLIIELADGPDRIYAKPVG